LLQVNSSANGIKDSPRDEQNCKKENCVNYFASVLLGKVPEAANDFFKQNRFNDPDCDPSTKAMGMLLERDERA
jgi:hypothetical protein